MERLIKKFQKGADCSFSFEKVQPKISEISAFARFNPPEYEKTEYGYQILPDTANGAGPIYFSLIKKI